MEYHDKMRKFRVISMVGTLTFFTLTLLVTIFIFINRSIIHTYSLLLPVASIACVMFFLMILIEIKRPDFVITDQFIVFSNSSPIYLISKKYTINYKEIEKITILPYAIDVKVKSYKRSFTILQSQLDNYLRVKEIILENAIKHKIMIHSVG
jgi:hypothetical protein